jgi:hypothetical protein
MIRFVAALDAFSHGTMNYPPILEAEWIGSFADSDYINVVQYTGDIIGPRIDDQYRRVFGPQTFMKF